MEESKMNLILNNHDKTMSSIDLRTLINEAREAAGESRVENSHLIKRIEDELEGELGVSKTFRHPQSGVEMRYYDLTHDQCILVGMRESKVVRRVILEKLNSLTQPKTQAEVLLGHAQHLVDLERKQLALQKQQDETKAQVKALVDGEDYFTVVGYLNLIGERMDQKETAAMGKAVSAHCRTNGIRVGKSKHPNFGQVNSYPHETLEEVYTQLYK